MPKKKKYYVRPDGLHEVIKIINGKRKAFRGHSDAEVEKKMIAFMGALERGELFEDVADEWEDIHYPTLEYNTLKGYKPAAKRAMEEFKEIPIKQLKTPDIRRYITDFSRGGRARKTVANQLLVINLVCAYAVEQGYIDINPCTGVRVPKNLAKTRREAANAEDEQRIKDNVKLWLFPYFILYSGLRKGEALALTYGDIDFKANEIHVTKSVYHDNGRPKIKRPKTEAGTRVVPLLEPLREVLKKSKPKTEYIFSEDGGKTPLGHVRYNYLWKIYAEQTGISATAHQLRHSFATMLFEFDIDVKDAQDILGHSTVAMTQDIYTHIRDKRRTETAQLINEKLRNIL